MNEKTPQNRESFDAPSSAGSIFDDDSGSDPVGNVTVSAGVYSQQIPVANSTVGEIRARFQDRFDIGSSSVGILDGNKVDDSTVVREGQNLLFRHLSGEKGFGLIC